MNLDRREFLVVLGGAAALARNSASAQATAAATSATPPAPAGDVPWQDRVRRVGQVNFNEHDPEELDVTAWADYWADLKVDVVLISVTGITAFYPTAVPFHRRSPWLGERDLFGECCAAAKQRGIRVLARFSPDLQWEDALGAHPEWFRRDPKGEPMPQAEAPGLFWTCMFSTYFTEQIPAIMHEVNSRYAIDGIYTNGWPPYDRLWECSCEQCRNAPEYGSAAFHRRYMERTVALWDLYTAIAKEKNPANIYFGNIGSGARAVSNLKELAAHCVWFNCDNQGRGGEDGPAWGCTQQGRVARSVMKGRTITNVTGAWSTGRIRWRNVAKHPAEAELWMAQTAASGMRIWYHWLGARGGLGEDRRWMKPGREFFQWMARYDAHFTYRQSLANLGVIFAQRPHSFYSPPAHGEYLDHLQGLYYALLESRCVFDFVHEDDLGAETLRKYSALLLPNIALLSDDQCAQLRAYVASGGSLLATFETGLYDQTGTRRADYGLGDLFGIARAGDVQGPAGNSFYARIERPHEILHGFADTELLPGAEFRAPVKPVSAPVLTVVPPYTAYPPERSYPATPRTDEPAVVITEKGASRLVYFPGDIDRTAWRSGNTDVGQLLQNAIRWVARDTAPVTVAGDGLLELFAWETDVGFAVHLVNFTNPNLHKGWCRRHYPLGAQKISVAVPGGVKIARVELLRAETSVPFTQAGGRVEFTVPKLDAYEVAALTRA